MTLDSDTHPLVPPAPPDPPAPPPPPRRRPRLGARTVTALAAAGLIGGGLIGGYVVSNAATTASPNASASASTGGSTSTPSTTTPGNGSSSGNGSGSMANGCALPDSGTVTAVGSNTVSIDGKVYAVTSSSDIDKNGESSLAKLAVGDKVTFSTVGGASTPTIDRLHAGNERLDPRAPGAQSGPPPASSPGSTPSA